MDEAGRGLIRFEVIGRHRVAVPTHFFKIVYSRGGEGEMRVIAFLLPNAPSSPKELPESIVPVEVIEEYTGLDFFNSLDDELEESVERQKAPGLDTW